MWAISREVLEPNLWTLDKNLQTSFAVLSRAEVVVIQVMVSARKQDGWHKTCDNDSDEYQPYTKVNSDTHNSPTSDHYSTVSWSMISTFSLSPRICISLKEPLRWGYSGLPNSLSYPPLHPNPSFSTSCQTMTKDEAISLLLAFAIFEPYHHKNLNQNLICFLHNVPNGVADRNRRDCDILNTS